MKWTQPAKQATLQPNKTHQPTSQPANQPTNQPTMQNDSIKMEIEQTNLVWVGMSGFGVMAV